MAMKKLVGRHLTVEVPFMVETVEVKQLSTSEVRELQKIEKGMEKKKEKEQSAVHYEILRLAIVGAKELTDEEFDSFPVAEIGNLYKEIIKAAGMEAQEEGND